MVSNVSVPRKKILPCETFYRRSLSFGLAAFRHRLQYILILQQSKLSFQAAIQFLGKHCLDLENFFWMLYTLQYIYTKNSAKIVSSNCSWLSSDNALCWTSLSFEHQQPSMRNLLCTKNVMCSQRLRDWWYTYVLFVLSSHNFALLEIVPTSFLFFLQFQSYIDGPYSSFPSLYSCFFPNHAQWYQTFPFQG